MNQKLRPQHVRPIGKNWFSDALCTSTIEDFPFADSSVMFLMFDEKARLVHHAKALDKKHQAIFSQYLLFAIRCVDGVPWLYFVDDRETCRAVVLKAMEERGPVDQWSEL